MKAYYIAKAKEKLDDGFPAEFQKEFADQFDSAFSAEFAASFASQIENSLTAQGFRDTEIAAMLPAAVEQAKQSGAYQAAYDAAYADAYQSAYTEAYEAACDDAWNEILREIDGEYADAEEKYQLNDPDFQPVPVAVYENFYRNEEEDNDLDGASDGTVRVFAKMGTST